MVCRRVRITGGPGVGQVVELLPNVAAARVAGGTAVYVDEATRTTGGVETTIDKQQKTERAVAPAQKRSK